MAIDSVKVFYGGMSQNKQRKYQGRQIAFSVHSSDRWEVGIVPSLDIDNIWGYYISDFRQYIILPQITNED